MRLNLKLQKVLAAATLATVMTGIIPTTTVYALDYSEHPAKEAIENCTTKGILKGDGAGNLRPDDFLTRAELATILVNILKFPDVEDAKNYKDVGDKWYASSIAKVSSAGIMDGYLDGNFYPNEKVTLEEAAEAITKAYRIYSEDTTSSADGESSDIDSGKAAAKLLAQLGYVQANPDGSPMIQGAITRAQIATIIDKMTPKVCNTSGEYSGDVAGNVVINTSGVTLKDMVIIGDLYIAEGTEIDLENVDVQGKIIIMTTTQVELKGETKAQKLVVEEKATGTEIETEGEEVEVAFGEIHAEDCEYDEEVFEELEETTDDNDEDKDDDEDKNDDEDKDDEDNEDDEDDDWDSDDDDDWEYTPSTVLENIEFYMGGSTRPTVIEVNGDIDITVNPNEVIVEGVHLDATQTVTGIRLDANADMLTVGLGAYGMVDTQHNTRNTYKPNQIREEIAANQDEIFALIDTYIISIVGEEHADLVRKEVFELLGTDYDRMSIGEGMAKIKEVENRIANAVGTGAAQQVMSLLGRMTIEGENYRPTTYYINIQ